jgi:hypothetical protein
MTLETGNTAEKECRIEVQSTKKDKAQRLHEQQKHARDG